MKASKEYNYQIQINDLINDAITNAVTRRDLLTVSDEAAASIAGGLTEEIVSEELQVIKPTYPPTVAGFKSLYPPTKPPIQPICPPVVVGLIALPDDKKLA